MYSSNVYLITGDWKRIEDVNTLIDAGSDPTVIEEILEVNTGVGKNKIDRVILTHCHSDHTAALSLIKQTFNPKVYAYSPFVEGVDVVLKDGEMIRIGDRMFEVIHTSSHSSDSICLHNEDEGVLFVGDTPVVINSPNGHYEDEFVELLESLCRRHVKSIYFGHGGPALTSAHHILLTTLENVKTSMKALTSGNEKR